MEIIAIFKRTNQSKLSMNTQEFTRDSSVEYVHMNFDVPVKQILTEYELIKDRLVVHRPEDGHKDWCAVTLYGFDSDKTNSHWEYDRRKKRPEITDIGDRCPRTIEWVKSLPYARIDDVRIGPANFRLMFGSCISMSQDAMVSIVQTNDI